MQRRLIAGLIGIVGLTLAGCHTTSPASPASPANSAVTASPHLSVPGTHQSTTTYRVSSPVGAVVVIGRVGDVTVIGGGSATLVTQQVDYSRTPPATRRSMKGRTLTVTYTCAVQVVCGVAYIIQVPRDVAVQATTDTGAVRLTGLAATVTAKSDIGNITATSLAGAMVKLTTGVGGISATFTAAPATIDALTRVGAITLRVPDAESYKVSVDDHVGKSTVSVRQSSSAPHAITVVADVGNILIAPLA